MSSPSARTSTERKDLIDNLLYAATAPDGQTVIVLTLRADFYGSCASYPGPALRTALAGHQELIGPMTEDELRQAIERPVQEDGYECTFEPGLVETLLRDVKQQPGALPLLQFALKELWLQRDGRQMTVAAYRAIGELRGTLEKRANDVFERFTESEQGRCRQIFLRLINPGEGTEDTKIRVPLPIRTAIGDETFKVLQRLVEARLITADRSEIEGHVEVEVAHEALIQGWPQLRRWIDADRIGLRIHRRLTEAAREWKGHAGDASFLFQGTRLAVARVWAKKHTEELSPEEDEFLKASVQEEERQKDEKQLRLAKELAAAQRLAEEQRRRIRTLWLSLVIVLVLMIILVGALHRAKTERARAEKALEYAETKRVEAEKALEYAETERAKQIIERAKQMRLAEANGYREDVYSLIKGKTFFAMHPAELREVVVGCMGNFSGFNPKSIDLNDPKTTGLDPTTFKTVAVHPEASRYAIGMSGGTIAVQGDSNDPKHRVESKPLLESLDDLAVLTTTGRQLICAKRNGAERNGTIRVWGAGDQDVLKCAHVASLNLNDGDRLCAAITPDGKYLAVGKRKSPTIWMCDLSAPDPRLEKLKCLLVRIGN